MKLRLTLLICCILGATALFAQTDRKDSHKDMDKRVMDYYSVEQRPEFPGGQVRLMNFIAKNLQYPALAAEQGIQGRVIVQFTVNKDGTLGDLKVLRGVSPELDREALRVLGLKTMPRWKPGRQNGQPVAVRYQIPIVFKLQ